MEECAAPTTGGHSPKPLTHTKLFMYCLTLLTFATEIITNTETFQPHHKWLPTMWAGKSS